MWSHKLFAWAKTSILSVSQVARITGMSHWCLASASFSFLFFSFAVLGLELRAYTLSHSTSSFHERFVFKIGSCKLYAQAVFKPRSS
jgi:hypothetical protein